MMNPEVHLNPMDYRKDLQELSLLLERLYVSTHSNLAPMEREKYKTLKKATKEHLT
jgi:hypothetical protein